MEVRKSGTPCFFVSNPTIKYYTVLNKHIMFDYRWSAFVHSHTYRHSLLHVHMYVCSYIEH